MTFTIVPAKRTILSEPRVAIHGLIRRTTVSTLAPGEEAVITITAVITDDLNLDSSSVTVTATADDTTTIAEAILTIENEFCLAGTVGDLKIKVDKCVNKRGICDE